MTDLRERFEEEFSSVPVPDLWDRVETLAAAEPAAPEMHRPRFVIAAAALVAALILVGGPLLLIRSGGSRDIITDPSTTMADPDHDLVPVDAPWSRSIASVALLPQGGVVAIAADPDRVFWSPDGSEWFDADPGQVVTAPKRPSIERRLADRGIVATGTYVAIRDIADTGVWVGVPARGEWQLVSLEVDDPASEHGVLALAANDTEILVVGQRRSLGSMEPEHPESPASVPYVLEYVAWIVDPSDGMIERHVLPVESAEAWTEEPIGVVGWFDKRWLIVASGTIWTDTDGEWRSSSTALTSADGKSWTVSAVPPDDSGSMTSLTVGPSSLIATECNFGGDTFWYSDNGLDWTVATTAFIAHRSVYAKGLGFLALDDEAAPVAWSVDGLEWTAIDDTGITLRRLDGRPDDPDPADGNLFVVESKLWQWSTV